MEQKTLYLECYSGISGDMMVGALLDLGANEEVLKAALDSLPISGWQIKTSRVKKAGIDACDFQVNLVYDNHDHNMEYLYGQKQEEKKPAGPIKTAMAAAKSKYEYEIKGPAFDKKKEKPVPEEIQEHGHHHTHDHGHKHRNLSDIEEIIREGELTGHAKETALRIFHIVAEAEAKAHNLPIEQVHFHEVGAVDSIIDIVAVAVCLDNLNIGDVAVSKLYEGRGQVRCQHGVLPIPVPATMNIVTAYKLPLHLMESMGEFVTPTGAAIAAGIRTMISLPDSFSIEKIGIGAGKREYEKANVLRAMIIHPLDTEKSDEVFMLETNLDDATGETLGFVMEELLAAGALDVYYSSIFMKKNRPAYTLHILCNARDRKNMERIVFTNTTTIGIRSYHVERTILPREIKVVETSLGTAKVKVCRFDEEIYCYPEYESVKDAARVTGTGFHEAYHMIKQEALENLK